MRDIFLVMANEWMKLIRRRRLWVSGIIGLLVVGLFWFGLSHEKANEDRMSGLRNIENQIQDLQYQLSKVGQQPKNPSRDATMKGLENALKATQQRLALDQRIMSGDWRPVVQNYINQLKHSGNVQPNPYQSGKVSVQDSSMPDLQSYGDAKVNIMALQYALDHNVRPPMYWQSSAYQRTAEFLDFAAAIFFPLLVIVLVADIVSGEATDGTIKLLLVRPMSRLKIMVGKWLTSLIGSVLITGVVAGLLFLVGIAVYGTGGGDWGKLVGVRYTTVAPSSGVPGQFMVGGQTLYPVYDHASFIPYVQYLLTAIGLLILSMMAVATVSFLCSTLFKSAMASTGVAFGVVIIGSIVVNIAHAKWMVWLFPVHLSLLADWTGRLAATTGALNATLGTGILVLIGWSIVCLIGALVYFSRKDVLNA
jgi:ABC-2 type transport system permease protein